MIGMIFFFVFFFQARTYLNYAVLLSTTGRKLNKFLGDLIFDYRDGSKAIEAVALSVDLSNSGCCTFTARLPNPHKKD